MTPDSRRDPVMIVELVDQKEKGPNTRECHHIAVPAYVTVSIHTICISLLGTQLFQCRFSIIMRSSIDSHTMCFVCVHIATSVNVTVLLFTCECLIAVKHTSICVCGQDIFPGMNKELSALRKVCNIAAKKLKLKKRKKGSPLVRRVCTFAI